MEQSKKELIREARREYMRRYRERNAERIKEINNNFFLRYASQLETRALAEASRDLSAEALSQLGAEQTTQ